MIKNSLLIFIKPIEFNTYPFNVFNELSQNILFWGTVCTGVQ